MNTKHCLVETVDIKMVQQGQEMAKTSEFEMDEVIQGT